MRKLKQANIFLIIALLLIGSLGCRPDLPTLEDFDYQSWVSDQKGCNGERVTQLNSIKDQRGLLLERTQNEIQQLLGQPDEHELHERTRKFFYYYLEPSNKCNEDIKDSGRILQIRFSAMGISNEIFIKNE